MNNHLGKATTPINLRSLELIRDAFEESPHTQQTLAADTGIPRSTLANILSRTAEPRLMNVDWFARIADALEVEPGAWLAELQAMRKAERLTVVSSTRTGLPEGSAAPPVRARRT